MEQNNKIMDGKKKADKILLNLKEEIKPLKRKPFISIIQLGEVPESNIYVNYKIKCAKEIGMEYEHLKFSTDISTEKLITEIDKLNNDKKVDGILVQLPLPKQINLKEVFKSIDPKKDIDGFNPLNKGLLEIDEAELISPTAMGVIHLINEYKIDLLGKVVTVIGKGEISGKPISNYLINKGATVVVCDINTKDISFFTKKSDLIITAAGKKNLLTKEMIKNNSIIINIGLTRDETGIHGDPNFNDVFKKVSLITPTPGGTGPLTVAFLLSNTLKCYNYKINEEVKN